MQYRRVSLEDALAMRRLVNNFIDQVAAASYGQRGFEDILALDYSLLPVSTTSSKHDKAIIHRINATETRPLTLYRQVSRPLLLVLNRSDSSFSRARMITCSLSMEMGPLT